MRQPFWIINSTLFLFGLLSAGFIYFARPVLPERESIEPAPYRAAIKAEATTVNISKIYENDLFDTYQKDLLPEKFESVGPAPEPPSPLHIHVPEEPKPQFVEPLPITLKGVVVVRTDDTKNRAIIKDNRTDREAIYRVGDILEDAQLIRIFSNKVILMRSNGQQEVIYMREKDAKLDPSYANSDSWDTVITPIGQYRYKINTAEFVNRIQNLGQFIDTLEVTTAYRQGESVGARINNTGPGSLAGALGLLKEDVILKINDISVDQTQNRLTIYNQITSLKTDNIVSVTVARNNREIVLQYVLSEPQPPKQDVGAVKQTQEKKEEEQRRQLEQKKSFAPTLEEIRNREKANMLEKGSRPTQNVLSNLNE